MRERCYVLSKTVVLEPDSMSLQMSLDRWPLAERTCQTGRRLWDTPHRRIHRTGSGVGRGGSVQNCGRLDADRGR